MTINITSTMPDVKKAIEVIMKDGSVVPIEFQQIRDSADKEVAHIANGAIKASLEAFQNAADEAVEALQQVALAARKNKLSDPEKIAIQNATEYQLAYIVMGYKTSVERLSVNF